MANVIFEKAGKLNDKEDVFLMSRQRKYKHDQTIFHNNDYHTLVTIPLLFFKQHFKYDHKTRTYKNNLKWSELKDKGFTSTYHLSYTEGWILMNM